MKENPKADGMSTTSSNRTGFLPATQGQAKAKRSIFPITGKDMGNVKVNGRKETVLNDKVTITNAKVCGQLVEELQPNDVKQLVLDDGTELIIVQPKSDVDATLWLVH